MRRSAVKLFYMVSAMGFLASCSNMRDAQEGSATRARLVWSRAERPEKLGSVDRLVAEPALSNSTTAVDQDSGCDEVPHNAEHSEAAVVERGPSGNSEAITSERSHRPEDHEAVHSGTGYGRSFVHVKKMYDLGLLPLQSKNTSPIVPDGESGQNDRGLVIGGIALLSLGFIIFLFLNWLVGLLLMLVGGGLWIAGASNGPSSRSRGRTKEEDKPQWQDVVYLKNGSVIKGIITEQVPNESIKIQTADGSVFVYEMTQVIKIAKEQK